MFAGFYFYWPMIFGRFLSERLGYLHFWLWFIGFNLTFGPMHVLGLEGMPRRTATYPKGMGWDFWNMVQTIGAFTIALSVLVFLWNVIVSRRNAVGQTCLADPWDARTLEWTIPSPTPVYNFATIPEVHALDDFWHKKYTEDDEGRLVPLAEKPADANSLPIPPDDAVHLPSPSYFPIVAAVGLAIVGWGVIYAWGIAVVGAIIVAGALYGWALEPADEPHTPHHDEPLGGPGAALAEGSVTPELEPATSAEAAGEES
jgi:cytochrome c oxidase subunit 1